MPKQILVIDDDPDVETILSLRLKTFGYEMVYAKNGNDGLASAKKIQPHLILLDYTLPNENGYEILKKLKAEKEISKIPVIMLTGVEAQEDACAKAGAAGYITKPFDLFQLKETLWKFLA